MPFNLQPSIVGGMIDLRPLQEDDFDALFAVASDPLIWEQHPNNDRYQHDVFVRFFRDAMDSGGALLVLDRSTGKVIGSSRFHGYNEERSEVEIGWTFLARSHWGGRFNGELKRLMLQHAFQYVETVLFLVGEDNFRSRRAVEKSGGRLVRMIEKEGQPICVYSVTTDTSRM